MWKYHVLEICSCILKFRWQLVLHDVMWARGVVSDTAPEAILPSDCTSFLDFQTDALLLLKAHPQHLLQASNPSLVIAHGHSYHLHCCCRKSETCKAHHFVFQYILSLELVHRITKTEIIIHFWYCSCGWIVWYYTCDRLIYSSDPLCWMCQGVNVCPPLGTAHDAICKKIIPWTG